jgi:hypothetical protein
LLAGEKTVEADIFSVIGQECGISRGEVKEVVNPMLHGQTRSQALFRRGANIEVQQNRGIVERLLAKKFPLLMAGMRNLRKDPEVLQRKGAEIFFTAVGAALEACDITAAGLPRHDGWIFGASKDQAAAVATVFGHKALQIGGVDFPVKVREV